MKQLLTIIFLLVCSSQAFSAQYTVNGRIQDSSTRENVSFASVLLTRAGTSDMVKGAVSDDNGSFILSDLPEGKYTLRVSFVGYDDIIRELDIASDLDLGILPMAPKSELLQEVQVVGRQSAMRFELDKKVFNVSQSIASIGGSASDLLSQIPSVDVDQDGGISLRGNSNVTVWINGNASGLSSENRGDILRQLPSESIERVEVITNPSSKYSAEGSGGIINIILKRERRAGYFGGLQASLDNNAGYNASGSINYSSSKLEASASAGYRHNIFKNGGYSDRYALNESGLEESLLHQGNDGKMTGDYTMLRGNVAWLPTTADRIGISGMAWLGGYIRNNTSDYSLSRLGINDYTRRRFQHENADHNYYNAELSYKHDFSEKSFLNFTGTYSYLDFGMMIDYDDRSLGESQDYSQFQRQDGGNNIRTWDLQLDYSKTWANNMRLETGYKGTWQNNDSPVSLYSGMTVNDMAFDPSRYNRFLYDQNISAVYVNFGAKIGDFSYQLGLRGEYTGTSNYPVAWNAESSSEERGQKVGNHYFDLFPSAFISYSMPHGNELQLNYTRRLSRPGGLQLNSFRNITDANNVSYGNPNLMPSYTDAFELNYIKNWDAHTLSVSTYYRKNEDVIQQIRFMGTDNVMYSTFENVSKSQSAGMELVGKNRLFRMLDLTTTVNLFYYKLDGFTFSPQNSMQEVTGESNENFTWNARTMANISLPLGISLQLTGSYNSRQVIAQGTMDANWAIDAGLRKSFADNKFSIAVSARDIFNSRKWKTHTEGSSFRQTSESWWGGRYIGATVSWNFGNLKSKRRQMPMEDNSTIPMVM